MIHIKEILPGNMAKVRSAVSRYSSRRRLLVFQIDQAEEKLRVYRAKVERHASRDETAASVPDMLAKGRRMAEKLLGLYDELAALDRENAR